MTSRRRIVLETDCVLWTATRPCPTGYAYRVADGRRKGVHRVAYEAVHGPLPRHIQVHHLCGQPLCVNVDHMIAVTLAEHRRLDNRGENNNGGGKLTEVQVLEILDDPRSHRAIARAYGVTHTMVGYIKRRQAWWYLDTPAQDRAND